MRKSTDGVTSVDAGPGRVRRARGPRSRRPALRCRRGARDGRRDVAAYQRARAGFAAWRRANPLDRAAVLSAAAGLIRSKAEDGAVTLVRENGKTLAEARVEVAKTADFP